MYIVSTTNRQTNQSAPFDLPLAERELDRQLTAAGYKNLRDISIDSIESHDDETPLPDELRQADIFELNFLFSSLSRFSEYDRDDFYAVVSLKDLKTAKEFINTALGAENGVYTFCHTVHDHEDLASWYLETEDLCLSNWVEDNLDYEALGRDLDKYLYKGAFADTGYVFKPNSELSNTELYDGVHLPQISSEDSYRTSLCYENNAGARVFISLPTGQLMWQKLYNEIGDDTSFTLSGSIVLGQYTRLRGDTDVDALNELFEKIELLDESQRAKLQAAFEYEKQAQYNPEAKDVYETKYINCQELLCDAYECLEDFDFIPRVTSTSDIGRHLVENGYTGFEVSEEMKPYIDYTRLGNDWHDTVQGRFIYAGYVVDERMPEQTMTQGEMKL